MTQNAAYQLATLLHSYAAPSMTRPEDARGFGGIDDLDSWRKHAEAVELVRIVDHTLQGMDAAGVAVEMFIPAVPRWYAGVCFAKLPWGSTTSGNGMRPVCDPADIALLEALGLVVKTGGALELNEEERRSLADVLAQARDLIENDTTDMPADVRHYLWGLITRAEMIVKNLEEYGTETVRQVAFELGGAMTAQAERADAHGQEQRAGKWRAAAKHLMIGFMGGAGSNAADQLTQAAEHVAKQLGGG